MVQRPHVAGSLGLFNNCDDWDLLSGLRLSVDNGDVDSADAPSYPPPTRPPQGLDPAASNPAGRHSYPARRSPDRHRPVLHWRWRQGNRSAGRQMAGLPVPRADGGRGRALQKVEWPVAVGGPPARPPPEGLMILQKVEWPIAVGGRRCPRDPPSPSTRRPCRRDQSDADAICCMTIMLSAVIRR